MRPLLPQLPLEYGAQDAGDPSRFHAAVVTAVDHREILEALLAQSTGSLGCFVSRRRYDCGSSRIFSGSASMLSFEKAVQLHQAGQLVNAEAGYLGILATDPDHAAALHLLGVVYLQREEYEEALRHIGRAIAIDPSQAVYFNNYGAALHRLKRYVEALACFHRAAAIRPKYADAFSNIGMAYDSLGQLDQAADFFQQALALDPRHHDARSKRSLLAERRGEMAEALRLCAEDLRQHAGNGPRSAELHLRMGNLLLADGKSAEAETQYEQALALSPDSPLALFNLGSALHEQHRVAEAREAFAQAARRKPDQPLWRLRAETTCPAVFQSRQQIDDFCGSLSRELDRWLDAPPPATWRDLLVAGAVPNFTYSYLGRNVRELKEKFAAFYAHYFRDVPEPPGSSLQGKRRIGVLVTQRHEGIFLRCMHGIWQGLSPDLFEIVIFCSPSSEKILRAGLVWRGQKNNGRPAQPMRFVAIPHEPEAAAKAVREAACDILYYWEAGSDALNYFLPFCRLAPVQCTSHGSQITSGNPAIGHFYSSRLMEASDAQRNYTEKLWLSETLLMDQPRLPPPPRLERAKCGLPEGRTLYVCLQNPLKFHPDFDPLLAGVLRGDRRGAAVLLKGTSDFAEQDLRRRFTRTLPDVQERIVFVPYQKFLDYCGLMAQADVVLDPLHFGHGSSAYDVFSFNRPLVTLPTELNVGRVGAAFYEKMGLLDLVPNEAEGYVGMAVRLGTDVDYRSHVTERIQAASHVLFDDQQATRDHERWFKEISS